MAQHESDRENLLREAVALARRAEIQFADQNEPVFLGFKRDGGLSIYLGADPVYQFNSAGQLRRAYRDGFLYRTQSTTLARLRRDRSDSTQVIMQRHDLNAPELSEFLETMISQLHDLQEKLTSKQYQSIETLPVDTDLLPEFLKFLEQILATAPQLAPGIPGKR